MRDVRLMHRADPRSRATYPISLLPPRVARPAHRCDVCESNPAGHIAYDDPLGPVNPAYYCKHCLGHLHPKGVPPGVGLFDYLAG